jgi:DNA-binding GntR family transcriptional regulator
MEIESETTLAEPYPSLDRTDLTERTYQVLKSRILTRQLMPGARISVEEVAHALGVSRTPVGDALKRLAVEGLVEIQPRRGTFVTEVTARDVAELFDIRLVIELFAAKQLLADGGTPAFLRDVADPLATMRKAGTQDDYDDYEAFIDADRNLHLELVRHSGNQRLMQIYSDLHVHMRVARTHYLDGVENACQAQKEHEAILGALQRSDAAALEQALTEHIINVKTRMLQLLDGRGGRL